MAMIDLDKTKEVASEFDKYKGSGAIDLYKHTQQAKISVSDYMESLDPTELDENGKPVHELDALERHLMVKDVKLSGDGQFTIAQLSDKVEYLMPELILREVRAGMNVSAKYSYLDCIAISVPSPTATYHPLYIPDLNLSSVRSRREKSQSSRANSGKGGEFHKLSVSRREKDIVIEDNGIQVEASYSVIRDYGWTDFAILLQLVGAQLAADKLQDIYDLGITGDGTVGAATNTFNGAGGTLAYTDLVRNQTQYDSPFVMSRILSPQQSVETILALAQFQDPFAGWEFQRTGKMVTPMGALMKQINATPGSTPTGTVIVTLDHRFAVREAVNEALSVEAEKIINRKYENAVISEMAKFSIIADGALKRIIWT